MDPPRRMTWKKMDKAQLYAQAGIILLKVDQLIRHDPAPNDNLLAARDRLATYRDEVRPAIHEGQSVYRED
jgi:hypothetical protein